MLERRLAPLTDWKIEINSRLGKPLKIKQVVAPTWSAAIAISLIEAYDISLYCQIEIDPWDIKIDGHSINQTHIDRIHTDAGITGLLTFINRLTEAECKEVFVESESSILNTNVTSEHSCGQLCLWEPTSHSQ